MIVKRVAGGPIIQAGKDPRIGDNVNGPSLIRAPEWVARPLGRYYLYFAHHKGDHIRMAYSDSLSGPWRLWEPGVLALEASFCERHIASPDVQVDRESRQVRMYYHGPTAGEQKSRVGLSGDGIRFVARPEILGDSYFRVFRWRGFHYALAMPGIMYRSRDGLCAFERGPTLFTEHMRHSAVRVAGDVLEVFYTNVGDCPERILLSRIDLRPDWWQWRAERPVTVLEPETHYEGAHLPLEPSVRGWAPRPVRQLRDPALFEEDGRLFLLYSVAGESGIAIAELVGAISDVASPAR